MDEANLLSVERLARKRGALRPPHAVEPVTHHGMAEGGQMYAKLVRPAGLRGEPHERRARQVFEDLPARARGPPATAPHTHPLALPRMASDRPIDHASSRREPAAYDGEITLLDLPLPELAGESFERGDRARDQQHPRGVAVEAMDDARALRIPHAGDRREAVQERVNDRATTCTGSRMHDDARRLVDRDDRVVLVEDGERQGLGLDPRARRERHR